MLAFRLFECPVSPPDEQPTSAVDLTSRYRTMTTKQDAQADRDLYNKLRNRYASGISQVRAPITSWSRPTPWTAVSNKLFVGPGMQKDSALFAASLPQRGSIQPCQSCNGSKVEIELYNHREIEVRLPPAVSQSLLSLQCYCSHRERVMHVAEKASNRHTNDLMFNQKFLW